MSNSVQPHRRQPTRLPCPFTNLQSSLKLMSIESVMPSSHLILCHPLLLLPSTFPSIMVFSNEPVLSIWWPKYQSFSFSKSTSNEYSELSSIKIDCFDLLAVQGTHKSILQHHSSKALIIPCSVSCIVQLSHNYKVMPLLFRWLQLFFQGSSTF